MSNEAGRLWVEVPAAAHGYDVVCGRGVLSELPMLLRARGVTGRVIVCSDDRVAPLHGRHLAEALNSSGYETVSWTMPAGESHKTLATVADAYAYLAGLHAERSDTIVALGGGVVGDVAGFVAASYLRGLRLVQAPTTLVAQVDSAIGGKVGVDLPEGKNLVGAFHHPDLVLSDSDTLATLPEREWIAGLAEVIKHGIIRDVALLRDVETQRTEILAREPATVADIVRRAAAVKIGVVGEDPYERGLRRILNYGHTLGHAIERVAGYGVVLHGEAVAWGMAAAARIARANGYCADEFVVWQDALLRNFGLLRPLPVLDASELVAATRLDKKSAHGRVNWVMPRERGVVIVTQDVSDDAVHEAAAWLSRQGV